ncbi:MAG: VWA domain-containing protein [Candidatus Sulfotelmatobacter sp.]
MKFCRMFLHALAMIALTSLFAISLAAQSDSSSTPAAPPQNSNSAVPAPEQQTLDQSPADMRSAPQLTIRQTVRRVVVDVMVSDAHGKPVHGLTANDFSIIEDEEQQRILSFDAYDFDKPSISRGPNAPPLPPNVFVNVPAAPEHGPLYVILYDLVNTEMEDQMTARGQILKFIRSKPDGTRFALFTTTDKLRLVQGFTDDKELLYSALDPKSPHPRVPKVFLLGVNYGRSDPYTALDMLTHLGQYLDGIPGRKNLIWVAGQFDVAMFPREQDPQDLQQQTREEVNALAQAQVAVFPVDVRGVVVNPEGALTGARPNGGAVNQTDPGAASAASSSSLTNPTNNPTLIGMQQAGHGGSLNRNYATEDLVASMTGGRAFYSTNDVTEALTEATEEGGNYYTLTYSPPGGSDDGKCHNITVKTAQPGYELSYRHNYCHTPLISAPPDEVADKSSPSVPLIFPLQAGDVLQGNMRLGAPMVHDLVFSAHVHAEGGATMATAAQMIQLSEQADLYRTHRRNKPAKPLAPVRIQMYSVDYRVLDPQFKARAARGGSQPTLEFAIAGFDSDGRVLNGMVNDAMAESSSEPGENKSGLYRVHQTLVVPVSAVSIRVGVRDRASDRMGTLEVPLPLKPEPVRSAAR